MTRTAAAYRCYPHATVERVLLIQRRSWLDFLGRPEASLWLCGIEAVHRANAFVLSWASAWTD